MSYKISKPPDITSYVEETQVVIKKMVVSNLQPKKRLFKITANGKTEQMFFLDEHQTKKIRLSSDVSKDLKIEDVKGEI